MSFNKTKHCPVFSSKKTYKAAYIVYKKNLGQKA